jgi:hypothetical protein
MARKPNYQFERMDRERIKAAKAAEKAALKKEAKDRAAGIMPEDAPDDGDPRRRD